MPGEAEISPEFLKDSREGKRKGKSFPLATGVPFQDPQWIPETAGSIEPHTVDL